MFVSSKVMLPENIPVTRRLGSLLTIICRDTPRLTRPALPNASRIKAGGISSTIDSTVTNCSCPALVFVILDTIAIPSNPSSADEIFWQPRLRWIRQPIAELLDN